MGRKKDKKQYDSIKKDDGRRRRRKRCDGCGAGTDDG
jgi:hypothetical protein